MASCEADTVSYTIKISLLKLKSILKINNLSSN